MKITGLNKFEIYQGEDAWLPMTLVGTMGEPIFLPGNWTKMTVKIGSGNNVISKDTSDTAQVYAFSQGPGAQFVAKLTSQDTTDLSVNRDLDMEVILETNQPGMLKQVFPYPKSLKVLAPPAAI